MNYRLAFSGGSTINSRSVVGRKQHLGDLHAISKQPLIGAALSTSDSKRLDSSEHITAADLYFTSFLVEHNLSLASADHFSKLCKKTFPDSKIAEHFSSVWTKKLAIVMHAMAPAADDIVTKACSRQPLSILCEGVNDMFEKNVFRHQGLVLGGGGWRGRDEVLRHARL